MDDKRWKGTLTELAVAKALLKKKYPISFPYGENQRYDLVVEINGILKKVQCKNGRFRNEGVQFNCSGTNGPYTNDADFFGVYCIELDKTYLVPVDEVGVREARLKLENIKQYPEQKIRWAKKYEI